MLAICREHKADICIIDPLVYMIEGDENESGPIKNMGRYTTRPLKASGVTLLLMDHAGKDKRQGPRGASAKQNIADVIWKMTTAWRRRAAQLQAPSGEAAARLDTGARRPRADCRAAGARAR